MQELRIVSPFSNSARATPQILFVGVSNPSSASVFVPRPEWHYASRPFLGSKRSTRWRSRAEPPR